MLCVEKVILWDNFIMWFSHNYGIRLKAKCWNVEDFASQELFYSLSAWPQCWNTLWNKSPGAAPRGLCRTPRGPGDTRGVKGRSCLASLIPFYHKVTSGMKERLEMSMWILVKLLPPFVPTFSWINCCSGLGWVLCYWVKARLSGQVGNRVKSSWGQAPMVSSRVENWSQPCLISLQIMWMRESASGGVTMFEWI